ncbi:4Fe-4S binding protein [Herbaspirillum sp. ST 5-3]|uniref:4Fe-4S binding protein n=1 Tax=Oxalobacteraceae TaxID=75682 RepID=UPI0010A51ECE|nr:4Fe-4S binding protein [Herbaspirillum sp. ST 5-3]
MASLPEFRASHCTRYRFRYSQCRRCADACPYDAVTLSEEGIRIDPSACRNCTLCVAACPTEALHAAEFPRIDILKRAANKPALTIACAPSGLKGDEVVPCLGTIDAAMLTHLTSRGTGVTLAGTQHCATCEHGKHAARQLELHLEAVAELKTAAGSDSWAEITVSATLQARPGKPTHSAGRRHLFRRLIGRGVDQIARPVQESDEPSAPLKAIRFARQFSTAGREVLQAVLEQAPQDAERALPVHPAIFAAQVEKPDGCTACEACARACPTGAVQVRESGVGWELAFEFQRCVGCSVCVEACQPRVLQLAHEIRHWKAPEPMVLHHLSKQRCNRCDRFFVSHEPADTCQVCTGDDEDFTALFG